jgi:hypothetical protein
MQPQTDIEERGAHEHSMKLRGMAEAAPILLLLLQLPRVVTAER